MEQGKNSVFINNNFLLFMNTESKQDFKASPQEMKILSNSKIGLHVVLAFEV